MKRHIFTALFFLALFLLLLASFSLNWTGDNFGGVGFDEIMFHLNMPLKGTGQSFIGSYIKKALLPAVGIVIELLIGIALAKAFLGANAKEKLAKLSLPGTGRKRLTFLTNHKTSINATL